MKRYYDRESAPLAFHTFFRYVSLPLGFFSMLGQVLLISQNTYYYPLYTADVLAGITEMALIAICFVGFMRWRSYAWYSIMVHLAFGVCYNAYAATVYASDYALSQLAGSLICGILIGIYYYKRKPLFFEQMQPPKLAAVDENKEFELPSDESANTTPPILFCRKCGARLIPEGEFCSQCGTKVTKEARDEVS